MDPLFVDCPARPAQRRPGATLGDMQLRSDLLNAGMTTRGAIAVLLDVKDIPQAGPLQWEPGTEARRLGFLEG